MSSINFSKFNSKKIPNKNKSKEENEEILHFYFEPCLNVTSQRMIDTPNELNEVLLGQPFEATV